MKKSNEAEADLQDYRERSPLVEQLSERIKELEKKLEHYKSHYEATLANWNITLDRLEKLREAIDRHKLYMWGDGIVEHPADEDLYEVRDKT